jgi:hypothetical protein
MTAALLSDEKAGELAQHPRRDDDRPGSASACARAAMFGTSPKISPAVSTTTGLVYCVPSGPVSEPENR